MLYNLRKTSNPCICNSVLHLVMLLFSSCREAFLRPRSSSPTLNRRWTNWENCWKKNETKEWLLRLPLPQPRSRSGGKGPRDTASLHFWPFLILCVCVCVLSRSVKSCPTLCDLMDCSLPGSSVHGDSPGKNTGVDCHALLQGIFPTQGSNPVLPYCIWIIYHLSHQGSPRILEWIAYPFFRGSSQARGWTRFSCIAGGFFTAELPEKPFLIVLVCISLPDLGINRIWFSSCGEDNGTPLQYSCLENPRDGGAW